MYKINKNTLITICRKDANFDRASDSAYHTACLRFGLNEAGYCEHVENWNRSTDMIIVDFESYRHTGSMTGQTHVYTFVTWIGRNDE